jgi:hypothetical protein
MAEMNLDKPDISFGIVDTIATSSQQLVDDFLGDTVKPDLEDIKDINEPEPAKPEPKKTIKKEEQEEEPFDPLAELSDEDDEKPVKPVKKTEEEEEESDFNAFESFSKELYNLGVFEKDGDEPVIPKTPEEFLETFNQQLGIKSEQIVEDFLNKHGEDYREAFDAIFVKGVDPREYFQTYNKIQNFQEIDLSSESNQEKVIRQALTDLGYEEEDVDSEVERIKNYGDLEATAQKHHKVLVKKEQQELQKLAADKEKVLIQKQAEKQQYVNTVVNILQDKLKTKEFDGIPFNPQLAKEVQEMLTVDKWKTSSGETLTDFDKEILELKRPENYATKAKLATLLRILKVDPELNTIKKAGITKQTNSLFSEVAQKATKTSKPKLETSPSWKGL